MRHGTCVTHVPWCMPGSLISGFLWSCWRGKRSRRSRRMRNPQFYVSGKSPMFIQVQVLWAALPLNRGQTFCNMVEITVIKRIDRAPSFMIEIWRLKSFSHTSLIEWEYMPETQLSENKIIIATRLIKKWIIWCVMSIYCNSPPGTCHICKTCIKSRHEVHGYVIIFRVRGI